MIAIPAVELQANTGAGVRNAALGRRSSPGPEVARSLADLGFGRLHLADSSAASWAGSDIQAVEDIVRETHAKVQVGAVGTTTDIEYLIRAGVDQAVVGPRAIEEPEWLSDVADLYSGAITVATDVRDRRVVRRGWVRTLPVDILDLVDELNHLPLGGLLVSMPVVGGQIAASDLALLEDVADRARWPVLVAGTGNSIHDLRALEHRGVAGVVIDAQKLLSGAIDARAVAQEFGS